MKIKEIRKLLGIKQTDFAKVLNEFTPCAVTDLSRIENGTMEKYLAIEHHANILLDKAIKDGRVNARPQYKYSLNDRVLECLREELITNYFMTYETALRICGLNDTTTSRRVVRRYMVVLRNEMPICDNPDKQGGWKLCRSVGEIHQAISKIERQKQSKSQEEYTLYRALKELGQ